MSTVREANSITQVPRTGQSLVREDLKRFGPETELYTLTLEEARSYCRNLAKSHYENFSVASFLVPPAIRQDFYNIYAYCRWSDDLADEIEHSQQALKLLQWWRQELENCFEGRTRHPVMIALASTIQAHSLDIEPFEHLLDAFVQDQTVHRYDTDVQLLRYCQGSANPVGRILLRLAQVKDPQAVEESDSICTGLQLANFCQDILRDTQKGRIYLPRERWKRYAVNESDFLSGQSTPALRATLRDWVSSARPFLIDGLPLVLRTPRWLARDVQLFARGGLRLLDNIAQAEFDVWTQPIEVTKRQKLGLLLGACLSPRSTTYRLPKASSRLLSLDSESQRE